LVTWAQETCSASSAPSPTPPLSGKLLPSLPPSATDQSAPSGTCYGLSAAIGKTGAAVGTQAFTPIQTNLGKKWTFIIAAICGVTGILVTYFFVPDMTGKDLADEDVRFLRYLTDNGWEGNVGEDADSEVSSVDEKETRESL
jgi:hypothetical protein